MSSPALLDDAAMLERKSYDSLALGWATVTFGAEVLRRGKAGTGGSMRRRPGKEFPGRHLLFARKNFI
jgi:hypothetical protein